MSRRMSCSMTISAVQTRVKTVTRRHVDTWKSLKPGDRLTLIEKGMGLPKGARQMVLAEVEVVDVRVEPVAAVTAAEVVAEGFGVMAPADFMVLWATSHGYRWDSVLAVDCRRIEWRYLDVADGVAS